MWLLLKSALALDGQLGGHDCGDSDAIEVVVERCRRVEKLRFAEWVLRALPVPRRFAWWAVNPLSRLCTTR